MPVTTKWAGRRIWGQTLLPPSSFDHALHKNSGSSCLFALLDKKLGQSFWAFCDALLIFTLCPADVEWCSLSAALMEFSVIIYPKVNTDCLWRYGASSIQNGFCYAANVWGFHFVFWWPLLCCGYLLGSLRVWMFANTLLVHVAWSGACIIARTFFSNISKSMDFSVWYTECLFSGALRHIIQFIVLRVSNHGLNS